MQRGHYFAIVDEVDSILIDEARTPLIISGPAVHTFDEQYGQWKPPVEARLRAQERLCARFLSEAEALLKKLWPNDESNPPNPEALERIRSAVRSSVDRYARGDHFELPMPAVLASAIRPDRLG